METVDSGDQSSVFDLGTQCNAMNVMVMIGDNIASDMDTVDIVTWWRQIIVW